MNEDDLIEHIKKIDERLHAHFATEQMHKKLGNTSPMMQAQRMQRGLNERRAKAVEKLDELQKEGGD